MKFTADPQSDEEPIAFMRPAVGSDSLTVLVMKQGDYITSIYSSGDTDRSHINHTMIWQPHINSVTRRFYKGDSVTITF